MKVLSDEFAPAPIQRTVRSLQISIVEDAGFKGLSNGDLIKAAEGIYDVLVTADKNLRYQQNLAGRRIAIVELPNNSWPRLKGMMQVFEATILRAKPGDYLIIPEQSVPRP
ncbi:MAG TPA: hypothetical protein VF773_02735 [Verrucomicrobiae bacterium]